MEKKLRMNKTHKKVQNKIEKEIDVLQIII